jgi:diguanylate cyclase (GGDEF)-like protein
MEHFAARTPFEMEYRLLRRDGAFRWIRDFGRPFNGPDGEFMGFIGACYDITDLKDMAEELEHLAAHDPLTGLPNRRTFERAVADAVAAARRGASATVIFADLDRFKVCNDRYGHERGDEVLRAIAQAMRATLREVDLVARIGGDEFAILLRSADDRSLEDVRARLREAVAAEGARHDLDIGLSMGSALVTEERTASEVLAEADSRMYECKRAQAR